MKPSELTASDLPEHHRHLPIRCIKLEVGDYLITTVEEGEKMARKVQSVANNALNILMHDGFITCYMDVGPGSERQTFRFEFEIVP